MSCWISKIVFLLSAYSSWKRMMFLKEKKNFSGNWWFCIGWVKFILRDENKWSYKYLLLGTLHSHSSTEQKRHASKLLYIPSSLLISSSSRNEKILAFIRFRRKLGLPFESKILQSRSPYAFHWKKRTTWTMSRSKFWPPVQWGGGLYVPAFYILRNTHIKKQLAQNTMSIDAWYVLHVEQLSILQAWFFSTIGLHGAWQEKMITWINCYSF